VTEAEQVAAILLHAAAFGDAEAARKFSVSTRTIRRYRVRLGTDKELAAHVREQVDAHEAELGALRVRFLRKALAEMERRLGQADTTLPEIAEAVKVVGELHQVAEVMGDGGSDGRDPEADSPPGDGADQAAHGPH
jgi:hypothetical protein